MAAQLFSDVALLIAPVIDVIKPVQTELLAFIAAAVAHWFIFGQRRLLRRPGKQNAQASPRIARNARLPAAAAKGGAPAAAVTTVAGRTAEEFRALPGKTSLHYSAFMEDRIRGGDLLAAADAFSDAQAAGLADAATYGAMLKVEVMRGNLDSACKILKEMRSGGTANCSTFNELLNLAASKDEKAVWPLFDEMVASGVVPNHVTCSILLKCANTSGNPKHLDRVLALVHEDMDDVLLGSVVEACIRAGRADSLRRAVAKHRRGGKRLSFKTAHGYGSIIRAFGYLKDMPNAWAAWVDLRARKLDISSITIGCMVEAVAVNGDPEAAHGLIKELMADGQTRPLVNAVIYCSVLKGFSHQKRMDKVWEVYEEMTREGIQLTIITYNTLVDACARSCSMGYVPTLLEAMSKQNICPNIITYSAIIKGYCQDSRVDSALEVFREMRQTAGLGADEHIYNTLINGCARRQLYDQGLSLLDDMMAAGVRPSNYTLSVLVKLLGRARRPMKAFEMCEELCGKFGLKLNCHVYNNLVNACLQNSGFSAGIEVFRKMCGERVAPDARTYTLLIHAAISERRAAEVAALLQAAVGAGGAYAAPLGIATDVPPAALRPHDGLPETLASEAIAFVAKQPSCQGLAETLRRKLRSA